MDIRLALSRDLSALNELENTLFDGDKISPRQMKRFLQSGQAMIFVAEDKGSLAGYALLLFHQGTQLSRLYSIAVKPDFRGRGIAQSLIEQCERAALDQGCITLRLEVREDNTSAIKLYEKLGFKTLRFLVHYYDDLCDGLRMQKRLSPQGPSVTLPMPLYIQTTPFTCGAACLLMSFACLDPHYQPSRSHELQLWREATTIFMAAGHGGCSGQGLALAAAKRGYHVELWSQSQSTPFIDSVRDPNKKDVIEIVHQDFCHQLLSQDVATIASPPNQAILEHWVSQGACVLLLISTYRFDGKKEPHWVILSGMNEQFFFIHDPHAPSEKDTVASAYVPVGKRLLTQILGFGKQKHTACVVIEPATEATASAPVE
ncbi:MULTISPECIES: GNAT family N-acetyltransferase/peptidase C39 family protein [unclassified Vibrio]|uniref:GNAT family N-acetyltransferase/peptidase C39 family protein n=1 Tax=unclassified Vibrio TaxID=2614977 RepID=UPI001360FC23|nr:MULTISPECIES: GNAT family N-acetyltransferase/peptidase C39 family protein [unclassified Vibrio]NAW58579.1 GNAT family N-acetyltransferase [Vibrio sp. V36_P2S2PM302]NAX27463.1 GNAT family N-acetyltransferase [Vibrio sp. V38_P2S17PM301]NAX29970.1 GNAT family N-acetyltransferase [Vibrio sp. V37_P2S8PM304]